MEESLYDTSRLIDAYKKKETIQGYTTILNLIEFPKAIEFNLQVLFPSKSDYYLSLRISTGLLMVGKPIPSVDSLIAAIVLNNKLKLVTRDNHFLLIEKIMKDFKVDVV